MRSEDGRVTLSGPLPPLRFARNIALGLLVAAIPAPMAFAQDARRDEPEVPPPPKQPVLTRPPQVLQATAPVYPAEAVEAGKQAQVKVRIHLDATGAVTKVEVPEPMGFGFDEAAIAAVEQYTFRPAEFDGVPGAIVIETSIHFVVEQQESPQPVPATQAPKPAWLDALPQGPPSHGGDISLPVSVSGVAVERGSRKKLAGVIVSVRSVEQNNGVDAITDSEGRFYFHGLVPGRYTVLAVDLKYDRFQRTLEVAKNEALSIRLWMRARGGNPYETVVEGEREVLEVTRRTIERRQMTTVPGTFGDPIRVIQTLPGLARTPFVTGFLVIRGSNPDDSGIFIDGHRVPLLFHFLGGPSFLNAEFLESIDLYPGGFPARFGRSHGGIVAIETRSAKSDGVHGSADVDLLDAGGYIRTPIGKHGALAVAGRRSYLDFMLGFFLPEPEPGSTLIVVPVYYDYQARLDYDLKAEGKASVFVLGSSDILDVLSQSNDDEDSFDLNSSIKFFRVIGSYKRPIVGGLRLTLSPAFGHDSVAFGGAPEEGASAFTGVEIKQTTLSYRMRIDGRIRDNLVLDAGIDMESRVTEYDALVPLIDDIRVFGEVDAEPEKIRISTELFSYAAHADLAWDASSKLRLVPGIRLDGFLLGRETRYSVDPRIVARYAINDRWTAKGYTGLFHQPPQPEGLDSQLGNPNLALERAFHYGLGAEWKPSKNWSLDAELYFVNRLDLVKFTQEVVTEASGEQRRLFFDNTGVSDTVGLEILVKREVTENLFGWLSYTLSRTRDRSAPDRDYRLSAFDQTHTLNAVASYRTGNGWELGGRFRYSTGRPETPIIGSTYDADANNYERVIGDLRSARRPAFNQVDARVEKTWLFNNWMIGGYVDVQNLFNFENVEATQYDYRLRDTSPVTGVPFVPTVGVRGQW